MDVWSWIPPGQEYMMRIVVSEGAEDKRSEESAF
jgi:hypothetical protein